MSKFVEDLWESIFTPGPTPTLLIATNTTFAVLQLVLLILLVTTYSIHFIILSGLSGGLWWAVNWFARELQAAQLREEQEADKADKKQKKDKEKQQQWRRKDGASSDDDDNDDDDDADEDTEAVDSETDIEVTVTTAAAAAAAAGAAGGAAASASIPYTAVSAQAEPVEKRGELKQRKTTITASTAASVTAAAAAAAVAADTAELQRAWQDEKSRRTPSAASADGSGMRFSGTRSGVSTEDEWEKVSESEK